MPILRSLVTAAALISSAISASAWAQESAPWPTTGHDAARTGEGVGPSPPYRVKWRADPPAGGPMSEPVVAADRLVVLGRSGVAALAAADGRTLWEERRAQGVAGTPAVAGDLVVYVSGTGQAASVVARSLEDGRSAWSVDLAASAFGSPAVEGDLMVIGTRDGRLVALDVATGEERWEFEAPGAFDGPPAIADGLVVATARRHITERSSVYALDADSGAEDGPAWRYSPPAPGPIGAPAIAGDVVVVGTGDHLVRGIGLEDGEERWFTATRDVFAPRQFPIAPDDVVAADRSHVYRLDAGTGELAWTFQVADLRPVGDGRFNTLTGSGLAAVGDVVLVGDGAGALSAIDLRSGRRVWRDDLGDGALSAPSASPEAVYVSVLGERGAVVALERDPDGRLTDEVSSTVLFRGRAVLNFVVAAAVVGAAILLLFGVVLRPRGPKEAA